jgi:crotonobetainyl-CoA:carnitine CoA-transferase CaiB-like acyl-CoA transferase
MAADMPSYPAAKHKTHSPQRTISGQVLCDLRVLDLTWYIAGPYCTKLLADYGAEVIKVERPGGGDPARRMGPFPNDEPHPEKSGLFLYLNTNKKSVTINLKSKTGIELLRELVRKADVLVENFAPKVMPSLGLSYRRLSKINPALVMVSISNFGQTGPYRDYRASELVLYGMGGAMNATGTLDGGPLKLGGNVVQYQAGVVAAVATMGAVLASRFRGVGQHVDVSIIETQLGSIDRRSTNLLSFVYSGRTPFSRSPAAGLFTLLPRGRYACKDGFVEFAGGGAQFWPRYAQMLGMPELLSDSRFSTMEERYRVEHLDELEAIVVAWLAEHSKQEVMEAAQAAGVACGAVQTIADVVDNLHFQDREFFVDIEHPVAGKFKYPGQPVRLERGGGRVRGAAPLLGEHIEEVFCGQLGHSKEDLLRLRQTGVI